MVRNLFLALGAVALVGTACGGSTIVDPGSGGGSSTATSSTGNATGTTTTSTSSGGSLDDCAGPGECVLASSTCCGTCSVPTLADVVAIHADQTQAHNQAVCGDEPPPCPACEGQPNPNLFAACEAGTCVAKDLREDDLSACTTDGDCRLRMGIECCEGCSGSIEQLVAVSTSADISAVMCGPDEVGCPECAPAYPSNAAAVCNAGQCEVEITP